MLKLTYVLFGWLVSVKYALCYCKNFYTPLCMKKKRIFVNICNCVIVFALNISTYLAGRQVHVTWKGYQEEVFIKSSYQDKNTLPINPYITNACLKYRGLTIVICVKKVNHTPFRMAVSSAPCYYQNHCWFMPVVPFRINSNGIWTPALYIFEMYFRNVFKMFSACLDASVGCNNLDETAS